MRLQVLSAKSVTEQTVYFKLVQIDDHRIELVATNGLGVVFNNGAVLVISNRGVRLTPNVSVDIGIATHVGNHGIEIDLID